MRWGLSRRKGSIPMPASRATSWLMAIVGLLLIGLMAHALMLGGPVWPLTLRAPVSRLVAVYFPDTSSWHEFRRALAATAEGGLADIVERHAGLVRVRCRGSGRELRFQWYDEPGLLATRSSLRELLDGPEPPLAVIGSSNSALTTALADELAEHAAAHPGSGPGPILLISAATAVNVPAPGDRGGTAETSGPSLRRLLDIYPRSIRFCLNNARMAEMVVRVSSALDGGRPGRVSLVVDPGDPFSADLAASFTAAIERLEPSLTVTRHEWVATPGRVFGGVSSEVARLLEPIESTPSGGRPSARDWLLLTIQGGPARQLIQGLREFPDARDLRVLSGDGIGRTTLESYAGQLPFPLCAGSSVSAELPEWLETPQGLVGQTQAEIAAALLVAFDQAPADADLFQALSQINWSPGFPEGVGRSLAFQDRDRTGEDVGQVLEIVPASSVVMNHALTAAEWTIRSSQTGAGKQPATRPVH